MQYITIAVLALLITTPVFGMFRLSELVVIFACSSPQHKKKRFSEEENQALADADAARIAQELLRQRRQSLSPIRNSLILSKEKQA